MTLSIDLVLLIIAFICFVVVALGVPTGRVNLLGVGLACWVLTAII
jgi:hypothetical protein